jgi:hypothetical protein
LLWPGFWAKGNELRNPVTLPRFTALAPEIVTEIVPCFFFFFSLSKFIQNTRLLCLHNPSPSPTFLYLLQPWLCYVVQWWVGPGSPVLCPTPQKGAGWKLGIVGAKKAGELPVLMWESRREPAGDGAERGEMNIGGGKWS